MVKRLHRAVITNQWFDSEASPNNGCNGALLRRAQADYVCEPDPIHPGLLAAVKAMNFEVAFTMSTNTTNVILSALKPLQTDLMLRDGSQLQVLQSMSQIASSSGSVVKRYQYGAFIIEEQVLLIWQDDLDRIIPHAREIEGRLLTLVSLHALPRPKQC